MKSIGRLLGVLFVIVALQAVLWGQNTYFSQGSVAPDVTTNWNSQRNGSGSPPADFVSGDIFVIQNTHSMTTGAPWTVSGANAAIQIESGGTLTLANNVVTQQLAVLSGGTAVLNSGDTLTVNDGNAGGADLQVSGTLTLASAVIYGTGATGSVLSGGKYQHNKNAGTIPAFTWNTGSTCEVIGVTATAPGGLGQSFYNFTWNCASQSTATGLAGALQTINGDFTVASTGTVEVRLTSTTNYTLNIAGNLVVNGGTLNGTSGNTTGAGAVVNVAGDINLLSGTIWQQNGGGTAIVTFKVAGNVNVSGGTYNMANNGVTKDSLFVTGNLNISGGTLNPSGASTSGSTYINIGGSLNLSSTGAFTPSTAAPYSIIVGGDLSISNGTYTFSGGTSGSKVYTLSLGGNFAMTGGSFLFNSSGSTSTTTYGVVNFTGGTPSVTFSISGGTFTPYNSSYTGVNWTIANGKIVTFNSAFTLPSTTTARTFTVQSGGQVVLATPMTINGTLQLSGNMALGGSTLTLGSSTSTTGTLSTPSGFLTGTGTFTRWFGTSAISGVGGQFPMGVGTNDRSVFISGTPSAGGTVSVSYNDASTVSAPFGSGFNDGTAYTYLNRYDANWVVSVANGFVGSGLGLAINGYGIPGISDYTQLDVSAATGAAPGTYAMPSGPNSAPAVNRAGLDQTSLPATYYFASTSINALPVEVASITATASRLSADIHWSTATEVNNFGFDIERKTVNSDWTKVGFVEGAGTSTSLHNYSYSDNVGQAGTYEYRIKQIDKTGSFKYSSVTQVDVGAVAKVLSLGDNYPNPFNPATSIEFSVPADGRAVLKIYNMLGQEVATLFDADATAGRLLKATFDASRLSSGVYFSRLESSGHALVKRMMLLK